MQTLNFGYNHVQCLIPYWRVSLLISVSFLSAFTRWQYLPVSRSYEQ